MKLDPAVTSIIHLPHGIPIAMKERVKAELERMTKIGVITQVEEPC